MKYFDENGRRIPSEGLRVFGKKPSHYYRLKQPEIDYIKIFDRYKHLDAVLENITEADFRSRAETLLDKIQSNRDYANLLGGVHIPFLFCRQDGDADLGVNLEKNLLPTLHHSFVSRYPHAHFKASLQGGSELSGNITLDPNARYESFMAASEKGPVVGWYFPQALQEFDVKSQRMQMPSLPDLESANICLSGGMDICAALSGTPDILISDEFYTPILCMSAYVHKDPRMVLLIKSYGPHMEFWCMTQMLTSDTTQVSEQWAGGLTVF